jgi:hypothetical protein
MCEVHRALETEISVEGKEAKDPVITSLEETSEGEKDSDV